MFLAHRDTSPSDNIAGRSGGCFTWCEGKRIVHLSNEREKAIWRSVRTTFDENCSKERFEKETSVLGVGGTRFDGHCDRAKDELICDLQYKNNRLFTRVSS